MIKKDKGPPKRRDRYLIVCGAFYLYTITENLFTEAATDARIIAETTGQSNVELEIHVFMSILLVCGIRTEQQS